MKKNILVAIIVSVFTFGVGQAQNYVGKVKSATDSSNLAYANIAFSKNGNILKSSFANKEGEFDLSLFDSGVVEISIQYAGHFTLSEKVIFPVKSSLVFYLKKDEKNEFWSYKSKKNNADREEYTVMALREMAVTKIAPKVDSYATPVASMELFEAVSSDVLGKPMMVPGGHSPQAASGLLTAGEINDFSKWTLWKDLSQGDLKSHREIWQIEPINRFAVQISSENGLPLADVSVQLIKEDKIIYSAKTDNTGKAELWQNLAVGQTKLGAIQIKATLNGKTKTIKKPTTFENGFNFIKFETACIRQNFVDVAFVVDATGSMGDEIAFLQKELNEVMFKSSQLASDVNFRFANVFYRDHGDEYLTNTQNFTSVLSEAVGFIEAQHAGGGGDYEEAVEVALDTAINKLQWSEKARARILFLVLDAPPHNTPEIRAQLQRLSMQAAAKGIRIVPLVASGINKNAEYLLRCIALATNGSYVYLTDDSGIGGSHIKPSTDTIKIEKLTDVLARIIKSYTYMPSCTQEMPELELNLPDSSVTVNVPIDTTVNIPKPIFNWKYFPNPTSGIVNILTNTDVDEMFITDLSGKVLRRMSNIKANETVRTDISEFASGIYLIRYAVGNRWESGKIVLVH